MHCSLLPVVYNDLCGHCMQKIIVCSQEHQTHGSQYNNVCILKVICQRASKCVKKFFSSILAFNAVLKRADFQAGSQSAKSSQKKSESKNVENGVKKNPQNSHKYLHMTLTDDRQIINNPRSDISAEFKDHHP
jgi:hypothetical protein